MKIGIIADTHGNVKAARAALNLLKQQGAEIFAHLGDGLDDAVELEKEGWVIEKIAGNNDANHNAPEEIVFDWDGVKALALHGHREGANQYLSGKKYNEVLDAFVEKAQKIGAVAVLFGHTHKREKTRRKGALLLNPGALDLGTCDKTCLLLDVSGGKLRTTFIELVADKS